MSFERGRSYTWSVGNAPVGAPSSAGTLHQLYGNWGDLQIFFHYDKPPQIWVRNLWAQSWSDWKKLAYA